MLLKFKLLELQRLSLAEFAQWASATAYFGMVHQRWFSEIEQSAWIAQLAEDLVRSGAAQREGEYRAERLKESVVAKNKRPSIAAGPLGCKSLTMSYFHTGIRTIIGAEAFHCPVRDGKEWYHLAMVIRHNFCRADFGAAQRIHRVWNQLVF